MNNSCNHTALQALMGFEAGAFEDGQYDHEIFQPPFNSMNETYMSDIFAAANCTDEWNRRNDSLRFEPPQYYSHTYRVVGTIFQGIVFIVGVLGNCMVVYVVARTKSMHSPTNCYLVSLALADCIVLLASIPQEILAYYLVGNQWIWGEYGCAIFVFSQHLGINASSLSLTAFTIERYIAICHPMKAQSVCTVSRAKRIILGVWTFAVIYCSPWLFVLTRTVPLYYIGYTDIVMCNYKLSREAYLGYYFVDLCVFYVVPLLLSVVLYSLIAKILFYSHRAGAKPGKYNAPGPLTSDSSKTNAARIQVVKMLALVVGLFAVLWLPYRGMLVYNSFATLFNGQPYMDLWFLMLAKTCVYINSAINPILYNMMSVKFRRSFFHTLTCGKSRDLNRWPYYRTNTTYTTASTALLPSNSTMTYNMTNFVVRSPTNHHHHNQSTTTMGSNSQSPCQSQRKCASRLSPSPPSPTPSHPHIDIIVDSHSYPGDDMDITQL